jgi:hypothetical protein
MGFEPTVPASERQQTHALDGAATGMFSELLPVNFSYSFISVKYIIKSARVILTYIFFPSQKQDKYDAVSENYYRHKSRSKFTFRLFITQKIRTFVGRTDYYFSLNKVSIQFCHAFVKNLEQNLHSHIPCRIYFESYIDTSIITVI